jgi:hypothetical protein
VESYDSYFNLFDIPTFNEEFLSTTSFYTFWKHRDPLFRDDKIILRLSIMLDNTKTLHSRSINSFVNVIGDLGGVFELIKAVFGFFFFPLATHSFILKAIEVLYFSKTSDSDIFVDHPKFNKSSVLTSSGKPEYYMNRVSICSNIKIYVIKQLGCLSSCCISEKSTNGQLVNLWKRGKHQVDNDLNVDRLIRQIKLIKTLLDNEQNKKAIQELKPEVSCLDLDAHCCS